MGGELSELTTLARLGLSEAALKAAIEAELGNAPLDAADVARAVAGAIDANNTEILRQMSGALRLMEAPLDRGAS